jgi:hypothetical protein
MNGLFINSHLDQALSYHVYGAPERVAHVEMLTKASAITVTAVLYTFFPFNAHEDHDEDLDLKAVNIELNDVNYNIIVSKFNDLL